jgi:GT2 family glycosyltransferase
MIVLNQDMYLESNAAEEMVKFMEAHPKCGIGAPLQLDSGNPDYVIFGGGLEAFPFGRHQHGHLWEFTEDTEIPWANGACMILRKEMVREIGLLDENLVLIGSDSDYSFTARSRGWEVWRISGARGVHERGVSGAVPDDKLDMLKVSDMLYFGRKWLTGHLYKGLAHEGEKYTAEDVSDIVCELEKVKDELVNTVGVL